MIFGECLHENQKGKCESCDAFWQYLEEKTSDLGLHKNNHETLTPNQEIL